MEQGKKIILFDGVCNLCNSSVTYVIQRDKKDVFRFAALQEAAGQKLITTHGIDTSQTDSVILVDGEKVYVKSTAALGSPVIWEVRTPCSTGL